MHEQGIAKEIIREAQKHGTVVGIEIAVGDLAHLPAHEMREVLATMTDWRISVKEKRGKISCTCGFTGQPNILQKGHDSTVFECPKCATKMPKILAGNQIVLVGVDVEE